MNNQKYLKKMIIHFSTKMTPMKAIEKSDEKEVYNKMKDDRIRSQKMG